MKVSKIAAVIVVLLTIALPVIAFYLDQKSRQNILVRQEFQIDSQEKPLAQVIAEFKELGVNSGKTCYVAKNVGASRHQVTALYVSGGDLSGREYISIGEALKMLKDRGLEPLSASETLELYKCARPYREKVPGSKVIILGTSMQFCGGSKATHPEVAETDTYIGIGSPHPEEVIHRMDVIPCKRITPAPVVVAQN